MIADGPWCPVIFVPYNEEMTVFTIRGMTMAGRENERVDFRIAVPASDPWFHQLYIQTCYVQIRRH